MSGDNWLYNRADGDRHSVVLVKRSDKTGRRTTISKTGWARLPYKHQRYPMPEYATAGPLNVERGLRGYRLRSREGKSDFRLRDPDRRRNGPSRPVKFTEPETMNGGTFPKFRWIRTWSVSQVVQSPSDIRLGSASSIKAEGAGGRQRAGKPSTSANGQVPRCRTQRVGVLAKDWGVEFSNPTPEH